MLERNLDGTQFESLRKAIDGKFNALHDSLEDAYYNHWKKGLSKAWHGFDVQADSADSKALFDSLHGALWNEHEAALIAENERQGHPYDADKLNPVGRSGQHRAAEVAARISAWPREVQDGVKSALAASVG